MSSFVWIDHSERQRRQVLDAIDLFREKDTRDELGLASIRDAISDALFPGTSSLQTRAGCLPFVPWTYRLLESMSKAEPGPQGAGPKADVQLARADAPTSLANDDALVTGASQEGAPHSTICHLFVGRRTHSSVLSEPQMGFARRR